MNFDDTAGSNLSKRLSLVALVCCVVSFFVAVTGLLGFLPGMSLLGSVFPGYIPMAPSTAFSFIFLSVILSIYRYRPVTGILHAGFVLLTGLVSLFGLLKFGEFFTSADSSFESLFMPALGKLGDIPVGIMSYMTGLGFFIAGIGVLNYALKNRLKKESRWPGFSVGASGGFVTLYSVLMLFGYIYKQPFLYGQGSVVPMALTTSIAFLFLGVGIITANGPGQLFTRSFAGDSTRARLLRVFLPLTILIILIEDAIDSLIEANAATLMTSILLMFIGITTMVVYWVAGVIGKRIDSAEDNVRQSEKRFRGVFNQAAVGVARLSPDGTWLSVNKKLCDIVGYSHKELLSKTFQDITHPDDLQTNLAYVHQLLEDEIQTYSMEKRYLKKNGDLVWVNLTVSLVRDTNNDPDYFISVIEDITERKQAKEKLRESEANLRDAQNMAKMGCWELDLASNRLNWSGSIFDIFEIDPKQFEASYESFIGAIHPDDRERANHAYTKSLVDKTPYEITHRLLMKDGRIKWLNEICRTEFNSHGEAVRSIGVVQDITGRKQAELALLQSEATIKNKLKAITEPDGDIRNLELADIIDTEALKSIMENFYQLTGMLGAVLDVSGKVLVAVGWQDICTEFHRRNPETLNNCKESDTILAQGVPEGTFKAYLCKNHLWDIVTPIMVGGKHLGNVFMGQYFLEDELPDYELFREQARKYGFDEREYLAALDRVPHFSKETVDAGMQFYSKLARIISTLSFSTIQQSRMLAETKRAEEALRESEEKLNALFTSLTEMVVMHELVLNKAGEAIDYRINDCNEVFTEVTGILKEDAVGKLASEVYQTDPPPHLKEFAQVAQGGDPQEFNIFYPSLDKHFMISVVSPQTGKFATITTDITAMMQIQELIVAKNVEMENYLYVASHDLRTPLVNIQGFSQRLKKQADSIKTLLAGKTLEPEILHELGRITDEEIPNTLSFVLSNIEKMDTLINGLLKLSRTGTVEMKIQKIDMNALFAKILQNLDFQIKEAHCDIHIDTLPVCYGDAALLDQLFTNIISNALKYSDSERALEISVDAKDIYNKVVYTIGDTGKGIAQKHLGRIWDVFYRIDPRSGKTGEGIGLSLVKRIVEKHKGKVWVESEENTGSVFHIELHNRSFAEF